ncbi:MAG TPA: ABC transporter permease [Chthonomonadaceae bacterium]|nr:ABC transporter permease [Chthonomonadaceae bacterium]
MSLAADFIRTRPTSERTSLRAELEELWRYRELLRQLVARELKVRYKNSALGFFWSIVPPLLQVLVYSYVFRSVLKVPADNYSAYLLCGLIPWTFISTAMLDSSMSLLVNYPIIKKVYMPREVIPLSYVLSNFIHMMLGWAVYFAAFFVVARLLDIHIPILATLAWFPFITLVLFCFVLGMSLWVSALNVFYEDVKFILQTLFNLLFFLLPVLYPADSVYYSHVMQAHPWLYKLYMLNPITAIINAYRKTILEPVPRGTQGLTGNPLPMDWGTFAGACLLSLLIAWGGYWYFNKRKWQFVERP